MDQLTAPSLSDLTTVAGAAILTAVLVFLIGKVWKPTPEQADRFLPLISVLVGIIVVVVASLALGLGGSDLVQGVVNGIFAGLAASGGYDVIKSQT